MTASPVSRSLANVLKTTLAGAALALLQACGGGGSSSPDPTTPTTPTNPTTPTTPTIATYGTLTLPGRLLVNAPDGSAARLMDLATGKQAGLPGSANASADVWSASQDGRTLVRLTRDTARDAYPVSWFDATTLAARGTPQSVSSLLGLSDLQLSADGKWALAQYGDNFRANRRLTVFDTADMSVQKQGSQLDGTDIIGDPQAWLPDGRYLYLRGNELWVSSPTSSTSDLVARLALPSNDAVGNTGFVAGQNTLAISPDGTRIAFTWQVKRGNGWDTHIFTARSDGTDLKQATAVSDTADPLSYAFGSPTWSPDGQWLAFVLYMNGATAAPVWPQDTIGAATVIGTTGCAASPVYVLPASQAQAQAFTWPAVKQDKAVKVFGMSGGGGEWVSSCSSIRWVP